MMFTVGASIETGVVEVLTSNNGGLPVEDVVDMALSKLIHVSEEAAPPIRDQAFAFKSNLRDILEFYIKMAIQQDRATLCHKLRYTGNFDLADHLRSL
jgi:hypothetical protein